MLQDVFLFSGTIEKNITLNDNIEKDVIEKALEISYAIDFVKGFPGGINEQLWKEELLFQQGKDNCLSFARALAHTPSIFILDEATANIDTQTEKLIQKAIENMTKERTTLIIAHRFSTIRNADKIMVLKHGEIIEVGNHDALMESGGYYKDLIVKK